MASQNPTKVLLTRISSKCTFSHSEVCKGDSAIWSTFESRKGERPPYKLVRNAKISWFICQNTCQCYPKLIPYENMIENSQNLHFCDRASQKQSILAQLSGTRIWSEGNKTEDFHVQSLRICGIWELSTIVSCSMNLEDRCWRIMTWESRDFGVPSNSDGFGHGHTSLWLSKVDQMVESPLQTAEWEKVHFEEMLVVRTLGGFCKATTALEDAHKNVTEIRPRF